MGDPGPEKGCELRDPHRSRRQEIPPAGGRTRAAHQERRRHLLQALFQGGLLAHPAHLLGTGPFPRGGLAGVPQGEPPLRRAHRGRGRRRRGGVAARLQPVDGAGLPARAASRSEDRLLPPHLFSLGRRLQCAAVAPRHRRQPAAMRLHRLSHPAPGRELRRRRARRRAAQGARNPRLRAALPHLRLRRRTRRGDHRDRGAWPAHRSGRAPGRARRRPRAPCARRPEDGRTHDCAAQPVHRHAGHPVGRTARLHQGHTRETGGLREAARDPSGVAGHDLADQRVRAGREGNDDLPHPAEPDRAGGRAHQRALLKGRLDPAAILLPGDPVRGAGRLLRGG